MPTRQRPLHALLILFCLAGLLPASTWGGAAAAQSSAAFLPGPDCSLLDDTQAIAMMSGAFEMALRSQCGRLSANVAQPLKTPVPAIVPPAGTDVRVNAVDPPTANSIQSETSLAVNEDTGTLCATFNDSYHFPDNGLSGFSRSADGGLTWQDGGPFPVGTGGASWGDPSIAWRRADGYFYYASLLADLLGLGLWRSSDDCATFQWIGYIHPGTRDDKEIMVIDNNPTSPYYGRFYVAWTDLVSPRRIRLSYSDDGTAWNGPLDLSPPGEWTIGAWPAIAANGDVYVAWLKWVIYDTTISVEIVRSTNGGGNFFPVTNPLTNAIAPRDAQATSNCGRPALKANAGDGIRHYSLPQIVVGPDGCLHVVYSYDPDGYNVGDVVDVFYRRSCDHGATWEPEAQLNDDGGLTDQFFPALTVNEHNIVAASWYDRRLDPASNYLFDRYWTASYDGGTTWEPNVRVSDVSSPVYTSNCYHGDYDQMATLGTTIYHIWSDDRVYFNGHYDPDVWFDQATIPPDFTLSVEPEAYTTCGPATVTSTITVGTIAGYNQPVTLSDSGLPAGVETTFNPNHVSPLPGQATYTITVTESAAAGSYEWLVSGTSPTLTHDVTVTLVISGMVPAGTAMAWEPVTPTVGAVVTFTADATGTEPISFTWAFGDGAQAGGVVVTHTYAHSDTYAVLLTATNPCGEDVVERQITVMEIPTHRVYLPVVLRLQP